MNNPKMIKEKLKIGLLQAKVDLNIAWLDYNGQLQKNLNNVSEKYLVEQFKRAFKYFNNDNNHADIILISEYTIPLTFISDLEKYAVSLNTIIIGGLDLIETKTGDVENKGIIIIPNNWGTDNDSTYANISYFGKVYETKVEKNWFKKLKDSKYITGDFISANELVILNTNLFGSIGLVICADIYDIQRTSLYKGIIQHLFVIAYNKDVKTFKVHAESISKMLMCNVVICNNGYYGDSLAFAPFKKDYRKLIYEVSGSNIFNVQTIELPCKELYEVQKKISLEPGQDDDNYSIAPGYKVKNNTLSDIVNNYKKE